MFKHRCFYQNYKTWKLYRVFLPQVRFRMNLHSVIAWMSETLIRCVNNQKRPRFYFYIFLYFAVLVVFPSSIVKSRGLLTPGSRKTHSSTKHSPCAFHAKQTATFLGDIVDDSTYGHWVCTWWMIRVVCWKEASSTKKWEV